MKKFLYAVSIAVFMLCYPVLPVFARPLTPLEGLEALRRSFVGLQDFTAQLTEEKQLSILQKKLCMHGIVRFKRPDRFMMVLAPPYSGTVLLKDNILEQRLGARGERQRVVLPQGAGLSHWFALVAAPVTHIPAGMEVRAEQRGPLTSIVIRPAPGGELTSLTVLLGDGIVRSLVLEERTGDRTVMTFRNTRKNIGLTDADFRLE